MKDKNIKKIVRDSYAKVAKQDSSCCGGDSKVQDISKKIGYTEEELKSVPTGTNLGLGCGNPVAMASLKEGEIVLDLGSGAGFDCFLAANKVGKNGRVIGVDMTPEMIEKARENVSKGNYKNVEFRLGEIENLPVADNSVDVVISNCVINLSPDKLRVFKEAYRALKPGGRLMVSDMVLLKELPSSIRNSIEAYVGCVAGAMKRDEYLALIQKAGFQDVRITGETSFSLDCWANDPTAGKIMEDLKIPTKQLTDIADSFASVKVSGLKPMI